MNFITGSILLLVFTIAILGQKIDGKILDTFRNSRISISDRTKKGMIDKINNGEIVGKPPKGYVIINKKLVIDTQNSIIIKNMFQEYIDTTKTLFGVEYSFQDQVIVTESGRTTMTTPYKAQKLRDMLTHYVKLIGLPETAIEYKTSWKPGYFINVPHDGQIGSGGKPA